MQRFLTGDDIFAHILLLRGVESKVYLVTEGPTDCALFDPHVKDELCSTIAGNGKNSVLRALSIVEEKGIRDVAGIVDRDLEALFTGTSTAANIFHTDLYDMEAVAVLKADVLTRLMSAYCDRDQVNAFAVTTGRTVRQAMVEVAFVISFVRYVSVRDGLGLNLRGFPISSCLTEDSRVDVDRFAHICCARSKYSSAVEDDVLSILASARVPEGAQLESLCCGHDLLAALCAIGQRHLGLTGSADQLHRGLRAALDCVNFLSTQIAEDLTNWGRARSLDIWNCA